MSAHQTSYGAAPKTSSAASGTAPADVPATAADPIAPTSTSAATATEPASTLPEPAGAITSSPPLMAADATPATATGSATDTASAPPPADLDPAAYSLANDDTEAGRAARLQADAQNKADRMEEYRQMQQQHPHMSMMAGYLKNFATTINPKANTAAVPGYASDPSASGPQGSGPATATGSATGSAAPQGSIPDFDPALMPAMGGFAAKPKPAAPAAPAAAAGSEQAPLHIRPDHPQRSGSAATAAAIEELQSGIEALVSAHINASRHIAGLPLVPVLINGPAENLPPITHASALDHMDEQSLSAWAAYYLGDSENTTLDRATMVKAIKAGVGIPYA